MNLNRGGLQDVREDLAVRMDHATDQLRSFEVGAARKARSAVRVAERFARAHPWQTAGIGVAVVVSGIALGLAAGSKKK